MKTKLIGISLLVSGFFSILCSFFVYVLLEEKIASKTTVTISETKEENDAATIQKKFHKLAQMAQQQVYKIQIEPLGSNESPVSGSGFGFAYEDEVYLATNYHIIEGKINIKAYDQDENMYPLEMVATEKEKDIAILKVKGNEKIKGFVIGDSSNVQVGDFVLSAGNPYQFHHSVFFGIVSAKRYDLKIGEKIHEKLFQLDAAINPGSSGGPVVNLQGEVIAMNVGNVPEAENIGFAIPINEIKALLQKKKSDE